MRPPLYAISDREEFIRTATLPIAFAGRRPTAAESVRGGVCAFGVAAGSAAMNPPPISLGIRTTYGTERPFGIGAEDARRHVYVVGQTASGKSTLLRNILPIFGPISP